MAKRTASEVYAAARGVGLSTVQAVIAVAVAVGESSLDDTAVGDTALVNNTWGPSVGVWQIRTLKAETGTGSDRDISVLQGNLARQAQAMSKISSGGANWSPWTVYTTGKYQQFMGQAQAAAVGGGDSLAGLSTTPVLASVDETASKVVAGAKNVALKVGGGLFGLALIGAGLYALVAPQLKSAAQSVEKTAVKAAKAAV